MTRHARKRIFTYIQILHFFYEIHYLSVLRHGLFDPFMRLQKNNIYFSRRIRQTSVYGYQAWRVPSKEAQIANCSNIAR